MMTESIKDWLDRSVLCWLATSSDNQPNVSPKEAFTYWGSTIIIANIASPQTLKNIHQNNKVCVSFIDILVQKGFQIKGIAAIVKKGDADYAAMEAVLLKITGDKFPFSSITQITIEKVKPIIAPSYILYPEITEAQQLEQARKTYRLNS